MIEFWFCLVVMIGFLASGAYLTYFNIRYERKKSKALMVFGICFGLFIVFLSSFALVNAPSTYSHMKERVSVEESNPTCDILEKTDDGTYILYDKNLKKLVFYRKE